MSTFEKPTEIERKHERSLRQRIALGILIFIAQVALALLVAIIVGVMK